jgi:hypothetical protein
LVGMSQTAAGPITLYIQRGVHGWHGQTGTWASSMLSTRAFAIGRSGLAWHGEDMHCNERCMLGRHRRTGRACRGGEVARAAWRWPHRHRTYIHTETGGLCVWNMALAIPVAVYLLSVCLFALCVFRLPSSVLKPSPQIHSSPTVALPPTSIIRPQSGNGTAARLVSDVTLRATLP